MSSGNSTRLLVAPDGSARLAAAVDWLKSQPADAELLVLAQSREAADEFVRCASSFRTATFGLARMTLSQLAARLAAPVLAEQALVPASDLSFVATTARAVHLLASDSALNYFRKVADKPGFPLALSRTLDQLRMNRVPPDELALLPRSGPDLARLFVKVQSELEKSGLADRATKFATAIQVTKSPRPPYPVGLPLIIIDASVPTLLEAELIQAMTRQSVGAFATAPRGDLRSIANLQLALDCKVEDCQPQQVRSSLFDLKCHLFEEVAPERSVLDDTVELKSFPGEARECVEIARWIQREAEQGTRFDRMAVLLRSPGEYRTHLEEAFRRAAIPAYFARGTSRPHPAGRALAALLACAAEGLSARRFAEYLSLSQVPDREPTDKGDTLWYPPESEFLTESSSPADRAATTQFEDGDAASPDGNTAGSVRAPWRWERLLVDSAVIGGKDRWNRRLDGLQNELSKKYKELLDEEEETRAALVDKQIRQLSYLKEFALPIIDTLDALPQKATWGEWIEHLRQLAGAALRNPEEVLKTLTELEPMAPVGPVDLYEVSMVLTPRLLELGVPPPRRRYGSVFVGSAESARGTRFDIVFVPGLAEKLFPRKIIEDPIMLDSQRGLGAAFERMPTQKDRVTAERLALRLAVGAATRRLYLSYPRVDVQQARPRVPSFYGLEAMRAAMGVLPGFDQLEKHAAASDGARLGWPAPRNPQDAIDETEYDLALLAPLREADPEQTKGTAHYLLSANVHLARALRFRARRWLRRWTVADGFVEPDELGLEALSKHLFSERSFSPTALQNFAACPYRFFLQTIHKLQPREESVAIEVLDPLTRGSLFHEAQFEVLTFLKAQGALPINEANAAQAIETVDRILDAIEAKWREKLAPAILRVWNDAINLVRADLREWLRRMSEANDGWVPDRFELSFGLADRDRPNEDPASVSYPVTIAGGLQLRGSIDLVERHVQGRLRATDHKTGKVRAKDDFVVEGGKALQPILYALALEKLLPEPVESGRLYYCTSDGEYTQRVVNVDDFSRSCAERVVRIIERAVKDGFLPAAPDKRACLWCDYRMVCGSREEIRVKRKPKERLHDLFELREMQ